jgi:hypothetical protein
VNCLSLASKLPGADQVVVGHPKMFARFVNPLLIAVFVSAFANPVIATIQNTEKGQPHTKKMKTLSKREPLLHFDLGTLGTPPASDDGAANYSPKRLDSSQRKLQVFLWFCALCIALLIYPFARYGLGNVAILCPNCKYEISISSGQSFRVRVQSLYAEWVTHLTLRGLLAKVCRWRQPE